MVAPSSFCRVGSEFLKNRISRFVVSLLLFFARTLLFLLGVLEQYGAFGGEEYALSFVFTVQCSSAFFSLVEHIVSREINFVFSVVVTATKEKTDRPLYPLKISTVE